jgi:uncharacterized protein YneF (UPF0154 family)
VNQFQAAELSHYPSRGNQVIIIERIPRFLLGGKAGGGQGLRKLIQEQMRQNPQIAK